MLFRSVCSQRERFPAQSANGNRSRHDPAVERSDALMDTGIHDGIHYLAPAVMRLTVAREPESLTMKRHEQHRLMLMYVHGLSVHPDRGLSAPYVDQLQVVLNPRSELAPRLVTDITNM